MSQEYYDCWAAKEEAAGRKPTHAAFLRSCGTPLITFEHTDKPEFVAVSGSGCVRINYNYYNEQRQFMKANGCAHVAAADSEAATPLDTTEAFTPLRNTLSKIRDQIRSWFSSE